MTINQRLADFAVAVATDIMDLRQLAGTYTFRQLTPSYTWVINHQLQKHPSVSVVDSAGTKVVGNVVYLDENNVLIEFSFLFSGQAYLN